ncbi:MAG: hypothetical protein OYG31_01755 [Candidatus Kaiserbacteria bacterium]|nr:hypothetical protein [Candidatus Kaiserbacteria bacterium]
MSYPSLLDELRKTGATPENATDEQWEVAYMGAFRRDLPLGLARMEELVGRFKDGGEDRLSLPPNSAEGRQFARLFADIPQGIFERRYDVALGFFNCCTGAVANDRDSLNMTMREQFELQDPNFVDC